MDVHPQKAKKGGTVNGCSYPKAQLRKTLVFLTAFQVHIFAPFQPGIMFAWRSWRAMRNVKTEKQSTDKRGSWLVIEKCELQFHNLQKFQNMMKTTDRWCIYSCICIIIFPMIKTCVQDIVLMCFIHHSIGGDLCIVCWCSLVSSDSVFSQAGGIPSSSAGGRRHILVYDWWVLQYRDKYR